jgi:signal transduction histidine kinase
MPFFKKIGLRKKTVALEYGVSLVVFLFALLLTYLLWPFIKPAPTPLFFAAIIAAFYGGFGPALLVSILSGLAIDYFFVAPFGTFELTIGNTVRIGVFITVSALVSQLNAARKRLMDEREKLLTQISGFNDQLRRDIDSATTELATANDVLFKTQQRLARSERLAVVGQIAASLAHEIGTPLNAISGHVELLSASHPEHADTQRRTRIIERQLGVIVATVKRLLERTHKTVVLEPLDINALIEELLWLVSPTLEKHSVVVSLTQANELPLVQGHRDGLQQVFLNLINNSIDAMPGGGRIEISMGLNSTGESAEIMFRDSGAGIGPDEAQHLFEPMWTTKPSGSGFGLAIAQEIVTDHSGEIEVVAGHSHGAAFRLTLPLAQRESKANSQGMVMFDVA